MSESDLNSFIEMGFPEAKAKKALSLNSNMHEAMEWLIAHADEPDDAVATTSSSSVIEESKPNVNETAAAAVAEQDIQEQEAHSLKCDECGKLLKDSDAATAHAYKTNHSSFSESIESIKPKTKEEIEEQKKQLQEKLKRLRAEREEREKNEEIEREKQRRTQGRQITEIRQKVQETEMKRLAEEKRREKQEAEAHKQKVRDQIAQDRLAFKKAQEKAANPHKETVVATPPPPTQPVITEKRSYDECRIQIRLTDGKTIQQTFKAKEPLAAVRLWIEINRTDGQGKFNLMQTFPRKQFNDDDMAQSLEHLGLVPASSLVITR